MEDISQGRSPRLSYINDGGYWVLILSTSYLLEIPSSGLSGQSLWASLAPRRYRHISFSQRNEASEILGFLMLCQSSVIHEHCAGSFWFRTIRNEEWWLMSVLHDCSDCQQAAPLPKLMSEDGKPQNKTKFAKLSSKDFSHPLIIFDHHPNWTAVSQLCEVNATRMRPALRPALITTSLVLSFPRTESKAAVGSPTWCSSFLNSAVTPVESLRDP